MANSADPDQLQRQSISGFSRTRVKNLSEFTDKVFVCVKVYWPSQLIGVMWSAVSLPHIFTGQA